MCLYGCVYGCVYGGCVCIMGVLMGVCMGVCLGVYVCMGAYVCMEGTFFDRKGLFRYQVFLYRSLFDISKCTSSRPYQ